MANITAVLFDIDDTLFDRNLAQAKVLEVIVKSCPEAFASRDVAEISTAFFESDRLTVAAFDSGVPSQGLRDRRSRLFLRLLGLPEFFADKISAIYVRELPAVNAPVAGAVELVEKLSKEYRLGTVSNGLADLQDRKLENIGLRGFFECVVLSEEVGLRKPDPGIFLQAAVALDVKAEQCVYVGDTYTTDIVGAKNAGMQACWFNRAATSPPNGEIRT